jgi:hypothetical protein
MATEALTAEYRSGPVDELTCVQLYGSYSAKCGYCKDPNGFAGMHSLLSSVFQDS